MVGDIDPPCNPDVPSIGSLDRRAFRVEERTKGRIEVLSKGEALRTENRPFESLSLR